jgi:hypothetical protein
MANKKVSFMIRVSNNSEDNHSDEQDHVSKIVELKSKLEEMDIEVLHLRAINQLVINSAPQKWKKALIEIEGLSNNFDLEPNKLV